MMSLTEIFADIVSHVGCLESTELFKIIGNEEEVYIQAMTVGGHMVALNGWLKEPNEKLIGEFGVGNIRTLYGLTKLVNFKTEDAIVDIKRAKRGENEVPEEIIFDDTRGTLCSFRLLYKEIIPELPTFLGKDWTWDVDFNLSKSKIMEFSQISSIYSKLHVNFLSKTKDGKLYFCLGEDSENQSMGRAQVPIANCNGKLTNIMLWPLATVMNILKLADEANQCRLRINDEKQVMIITLESEYATYDYILRPAKERDM